MDASRPYSSRSLQPPPGSFVPTTGLDRYQCLPVVLAGTVPSVRLTTSPWAGDSAIFGSLPELHAPTMTLGHLLLPGQSGPRPNGRPPSKMVDFKNGPRVPAQSAGPHEPALRTPAGVRRVVLGRGVSPSSPSSRAILIRTGGVTLTPRYRVWPGPYGPDRLSQ